MDINAQITVRPATPEDISNIMRLEHSSNTAAHWSEQQYQLLFRVDDPGISRLTLVAQQQADSTILGFLIAQHIGPEWELENIVVDSQMQGRGIGTCLLGELIHRAKQVNSEAVFLEVRESNQAATRLYRRLGFEVMGRRKSYYGNPLEDAILYRKTLSPAISR